MAYFENGEETVALLRRKRLSLATLVTCGLVAAACGGNGGAKDKNVGDGDGDLSTGGVAGDGDGDEGTGGTGTGGGATTPNSTVQQIPRSADRHQLDLLFVIDNSVSMSDKQEILENAVPPLVERLVNPFCENAAGDKVVNPGTCPVGYAPEFLPLEDMHIGIISSSLGGHGASLCAANEVSYNNDDKGRLIPSMRAGAPDPDGTAFLAWSGGDTAAKAALLSAFEGQLGVVGEVGCGFEAPLEAMYRFLVDPQPPLEIVVDPATDRSKMEEDEFGTPLVDTTLLAQREAFLRPEGMVAIVIVTDENDCSAMDGGSYYNNAGFGYLVAEATFDMRLATSVCEDNPNDACCFSCLQKNSPPAGCEDVVSECDANPVLSPSQDRANVRCFANKRRFGVDLLYPIERYVDALREPRIVDARTGDMVDNPLLRGVGANAGIHRAPGAVYLTGIVGVPWQDLATDESLTNDDVLEYRSALELNVENVSVGETMYSRWDVILGDPGMPASHADCETNPDCGKAPIPPLDPFMIESIVERPAGAANPISGDNIVPSTSNDPLANAINGHEADNTIVDLARYPDAEPVHDELQYACTFPLVTPKLDCSEGDLTCLCGGEPSKNRSVCQEPGVVAPASNNQYFGAAYPGIRILQVLRAFGENSVVGSICPKIATGDTSNPNYGYNPALQGLADRLAVFSHPGCLYQELETEPDGTVRCEAVEATAEFNLDCSSAGRSAVDDVTLIRALEELRDAGRCDGDSGVDCDDFSVCAIDQLTTAGRDECLTSTADPTSLAVPGFCYIDPSVVDTEGNYVAGGSASGNPIVAECPDNAPRLLRFVGQNTPAQSTTVLLICEEGVSGE